MYKRQCPPLYVYHTPHIVNFIVIKFEMLRNNYPKNAITAVWNLGYTFPLSVQPGQQHCQMANISQSYLYPHCFPRNRNSWWSDLKYATSKTKWIQWNFIGTVRWSTQFIYLRCACGDCNDEQAKICSFIRISFLCDLVLYECNVVKKNCKYFWYYRVFRNGKNALL